MKLFIDLKGNCLGNATLHFIDEIFQNMGTSHPILSDPVIKIMNDLPVIARCNGNGELVISGIRSASLAKKLANRVEELSGKKILETEQMGPFFEI